MIRTIVHTRRSATMLATTGVLVAGVLAGALGATAPALAAASAPDAARTTAVADPNDALLRAGQMPVVNDVQDWKRVATRKTRVSNAQPGSLKALGFIRKARRDFGLPGASATNVVLTFATATKASAAYAEIKSWRRHTGDHVPAAGKLLYTGKNTPVAVESGRGSYFSFTFLSDRAAIEGTFEWLGVTRRGAAVSIVAWRVGGQDATYDVDPTIASVNAANRKLTRLG
jgi:hypothetical protein